MPTSSKPPPSDPPETGPERFLRVDHLTDDLRRRSVQGGAITIGNQGIKFVLALTSTAILARILTPADFGLIAMVMAIIGFIAIFKDLGLSMATIQRADVSQGQVSTLFWINVGMSIVFMAIVATLSPVLVWYYDEPRVAPITLALAGTIIFSGLIVQHQALLRRQMRFGLIALIELTTIVLSLASGVTAALAGWGYWSLVVIPVVREATMMLGVWTFCRWRPGKPVRRSGVRSMVSFGAHLTAFNVVNYFARNLDNILIGRYWGASPLGLYNKAYQMLLLPIQQINSPITSVAVPTLSRLQNDPERYRVYYRRGVFLTASIGMPIVAFLFVVADDAVLTLLGNQWVEAVPIFRALGPAAFMGTLNMVTGWVYLSLGKTRRMLAWGVFASIIIALVFILSVRWGPITVALAYSASLVVLVPLAIIYCFRASPLYLADFRRAVWRPVTASLSAGAALFGATTFYGAEVNAAGQLVISCFVYAGLYGGIWVGLPGGRQALREVVDIAATLRPDPSQMGNEP